jgi:hypothetical protein
MCCRACASRRPAANFFPSPRMPLPTPAQRPEWTFPVPAQALRRGIAVISRIWFSTLIHCIPFSLRM